MPITKASSLVPAISMPIALAAVSSSRTDRIVRPVLERITLRMMMITTTIKKNAQNQLVTWGMPIIPRPPRISGKGKMVSEFTIKVFTTMVKPSVAIPK